MLTFETGNILKAETEALVNTVNTVGVMGKGIALQFKKQFPECFRAYKAAIDKGELRIGKVQVVEVNNIVGPRYIINFPTKKHWRYPSKMEWIKEGLKDLKRQIYRYKIRSIAIPPLGAGNGKLEWEQVKTEIENILGNTNIQIFVFEPSCQVNTMLKNEESDKRPQLTAPRAMMLNLLYHYRALDEFACEFAAEKLSYFLQRFGEQKLQLKFERSYYGPYSGKIRHLLYALNGYYLKGYEQKNAAPFDELELMVDKKPEVEQYLRENTSSSEQNRLKQVAEFISGFETPLGLELLATVDFLINENETFDPQFINHKIQQWSLRKEKMFSERLIGLAIDHLKRFRDPLYPQLSAC